MKKKFKIAAVAGLSIITLALSPFFAKAGNTDKTTWSFTVGEHGDTGFIVEEGREKYNTSSIYLECTRRIDYTNSRGSGFTATVYGSNDRQTGFANQTYNGKSSKTYSVTPGNVYYMVNYVRETNCKYANVFYDAKYNANQMYYGQWSPDSKE